MLYYGRKLGMTTAEIEVTRWGEMMDMLACMAISNGAKQKKKKKKKVLSFEDVFFMR